VSEIKEDATEVIEDGAYEEVGAQHDEQEGVARHMDWKRSDQEGVG
jgi:hypothetical protein